MTAVHDAVMERAASAAAYGTSGAVALTGFSYQELYGLIGVALAALTFLVNWYYKARTDSREERAQMLRELQQAQRIRTDSDAG